MLGLGAAAAAAARGQGRGRGGGPGSGRCSLLAFQSRGCRLCGRLRAPLAALAAAEADWLEVVEAEVADPAWLPEVIHYGVAHVPCYVLLDPRGLARFRSPAPDSLRLMEQALQAVAGCRGRRVVR